MSENQQVITTSQAKAQINHFGIALVIYIVSFTAMTYGAPYLMKEYPDIWMGMNPSLILLILSLGVILLCGVFPITIAAKNLHLNFRDYYQNAKLSFFTMISLGCIGVGIQLICTMVTSIVGIFFKTNTGSFTFLGNFTSTTYIVINILYFLINVILLPVVEEYIFRGIVQRQLGHYGRYFGVLGSAFLFALVQPNLVQAISSFFLGWFLALVTLRYHSVRPAMGISCLISLFYWVIEILPLKYIWIVTILVIGVYIIAGLSIFQKRVNVRMARTGATEPKLWKILLSTPSIIVCMILFVVNVVLSFI